VEEEEEEVKKNYIFWLGSFLDLSAFYFFNFL
jgi:hypothetical protein